MTGDPGNVTWSEAGDFCLSKWAALASFQNVEEEKAFLAALRAGFIGHITQFFFGLIRKPTSATVIYSYQLPDGSPLTYARWNRLGAFNDKKSCGLLAIPVDYSTVYWRAESCSSKHEFFCKKPRSETYLFVLCL